MEAIEKFASTRGVYRNKLIGFTGSANDSARREPPHAVNESRKAEEQPQQDFNGETSAGELLAFSDAPTLGANLLAHNAMES
jgi:hypothetical protein